MLEMTRAERRNTETDKMPELTPMKTERVDGRHAATRAVWSGIAEFLLWRAVRGTTVGRRQPLLMMLVLAKGLWRLIAVTIVTALFTVRSQCRSDMSGSPGTSIDVHASWYTSVLHIW